MFLKKQILFSVFIFISLSTSCRTEPSLNKKRFKPLTVNEIKKLENSENGWIVLFKSVLSNNNELNDIVQLKQIIDTYYPLSEKMEKQTLKFFHTIISNEDSNNFSHFIKKEIIPKSFTNNAVELFLNIPIPENDRYLYDEKKKFLFDSEFSDPNSEVYIRSEIDYNIKILNMINKTISNGEYHLLKVKEEGELITSLKNFCIFNNCIKIQKQYNIRNIFEVYKKMYPSITFKYKNNIIYVLLNSFQVNDKVNSCPYLMLNFFNEEEQINEYFKIFVYDDKILRIINNFDDFSFDKK